MVSARRVPWVYPMGNGTGLKLAREGAGEQRVIVAQDIMAQFSVPKEHRTLANFLFEFLAGSCTTACAFRPQNVLKKSTERSPIFRWTFLRSRQRPR